MPMKKTSAPIARLAGLAVTLSLVACSAKTDGPTPTVTSVEPDLVCTAQQDVTLTITGTGFSPVVAVGLTDSPAVLMPQVFLVDAAGVIQVGQRGFEIR